MAQQLGACLCTLCAGMGLSEENLKGGLTFTVPTVQSGYKIMISAGEVRRAAVAQLQQRAFRTAWMEISMPVPALGGFALAGAAVDLGCQMPM